MEASCRAASYSTMLPGNACIQRLNLLGMWNRDQFIGLREHSPGQAGALAPNENCRRPSKIGLIERSAFMR